MSPFCFVLFDYCNKGLQITEDQKLTRGRDRSSDLPTVNGKIVSRAMMRRISNSQSCLSSKYPCSCRKLSEDRCWNIRGTTCPRFYRAVLVSHYSPSVVIAMYLSWKCQYPNLRVSRKWKKNCMPKSQSKEGTWEPVPGPGNRKETERSDCLNDQAAQVRVIESHAAEHQPKLKRMLSPWTLKTDSELYCCFRPASGAPVPQLPFDEGFLPPCRADTAWQVLSDRTMGITPQWKGWERTSLGQSTFSWILKSSNGFTKSGLFIPKNSKPSQRNKFSSFTHPYG